MTSKSQQTKSRVLDPRVHAVRTPAGLRYTGEGLAPRTFATRDDALEALTHAVRDKLLAEIARAELFLETLETRKRDSLDFQEQSVWGIKAALEAAYDAGRKAGIASRS